MADLLRRGTEAMAQLSNEQINWRPNEESNSIANLVIHLEGNLQHFVEAEIGGDRSRRDRNYEFNAREPMSPEEAVNRLTGAVERTRAIMAELAPDRLTEMVPFVNRQVTIQELLLILTTHLGEHIGQVLYNAKLLKGGEYRVVSFPHKKA
jgi:uncharacterized damage-inducible protein DinB